MMARIDFVYFFVFLIEFHNFFIYFLWGYPDLMTRVSG